jgi:hypothetical protein
MKAILKLVRCLYKKEIIEIFGALELVLSGRSRPIDIYKCNNINDHSLTWYKTDNSWTWKIMSDKHLGDNVLVLYLDST